MAGNPGWPAGAVMGGAARVVGGGPDATGPWRPRVVLVLAEACAPEAVDRGVRVPAYGPGP